jgi:hypothetical protein
VYTKSDCGTSFGPNTVPSGAEVGAPNVISSPSFSTHSATFTRFTNTPFVPRDTNRNRSSAPPLPAAAVMLVSDRLPSPLSPPNTSASSSSALLPVLLPLVLRSMRVLAAGSATDEEVVACVFNRLEARRVGEDDAARGCSEDSRPPLLAELVLPRLSTRSIRA